MESSNYNITYTERDGFDYGRRFGIDYEMKIRHRLQFRYVCCLLISVIKFFIFCLKIMKKLSDKQIKLAYMYAKRSKIDVYWLIDKLEKWEVTFSELQQGILWVRTG